MKNLLKQIVLFILQKEARICLKNNKPKIIAVYGKISRSAFKDDIVNRLKAQGLAVRGSFKGYNSRIGIPLSILGLEAGISSPWKWLLLLIKGYKLTFKSVNYPKFLVLEIAADSEVEIENINRIIKPDCLIVSDFEPGQPAQNLLIVEKIVNNLAGQGTILLNGDSQDFLRFRKDEKNKIIIFGQGEGADLKAIDIIESEIGQEFVLVYGAKREEARLNKFGIQSVYSELVSRFLADYFKSI